MPNIAGLHQAAAARDRRSMVNEDLAALIESAKGRKTLSYEALSKACGGTPSGARLNQIVKTGIKTFPDTQTIYGLARGCDTTPEQVVLAAARSLGVDVRSNDPDRPLIPGYGSLPAHLQDTFHTLGRQVAGLAQSQQETNHDRHDAQEQEPRPEAQDAQHESADRAEDGSTPQRAGAPMSGDDELARRRKPWKKNLPPQLSPEELAELERRQEEGDNLSHEEIATWAAHDGTYTPENDKL